MLVKFFRRGKGGGDSPVNYLLGENRDRQGATVLRGNAELTRELINSTNYARRYTSGCLSFEEQESAITDDQKRLVMELFEQTIFTGLQSDQYNILWVEHTDKNGRLELNFLIPNMELRTGKRLQPYYHGADKRRVNAYQNLCNAKFNWSDPHDPKKRRISNPYISHNSNITSKNNTKNSLNSLTDRTEFVGRLTQIIYDRVQEGAIYSRQALIDELPMYGLRVERVTKKFISVSHPEHKKNFRLKGQLFDDDFQPELFKKTKLEQDIFDYDHSRKQRFLNAKDELKKGLKIKRLYHEKKFNTHPPMPLDTELKQHFSNLLQPNTAENRPKIPQNEPPRLDY